MFKLGNEKRNYGTPILKGNLRKGVVAEANNDGTIVVDSNIPEGSEVYNRAIKHEMQHMKDMESGKAAYGENWVAWEGNVYFRRTIDGEAVIDGPAGRLPEGHPDHPWEQSAIQAENE
tara:strand:+ start:723 stop:1076 length:354 start_codon:yes stop_codon:yes gene_type:complete